MWPLDHAKADMNSADAFHIDSFDFGIVVGLLALNFSSFD